LRPHLYNHVEFEGHNHEEAVKWYRASAELGNADAQNSLGAAYFNGKGVEQNYEEAVKWCRASAEQGNADGHNFLGWAYLQGKGVEQNYEEAAKWCRASADQGNASGQDSLGDCYRQWDGAGQNLEEAAKWYLASAEQGNDCGQNNLGECYRDGLGVERNLQEATKWFRVAAEQGHDEAKANLQALEQASKNRSAAQPPRVPNKSAVKNNPKNASAQPASSASVMQLLGFVGLIIPLGNILAPLILWMATRGGSQYLDSAGKEAINFQISYTIYLIVSIILCKAWIGLLLFPVIGLMWMIFMVVAAAKTGNGGEYRYPFTIRFLKQNKQ